MMSRRMASTSAHRRTGSRRRAAATALVTLLVVLALGEAGARYSLGDEHPPRARNFTPQMRCGMHDPDLGWRLRPGAHSRTRGFGDVEVYDVTINSKGLLDDEHDYVAPPGVQRIVLLGDSVAWGWGVSVERGFARLLERELGPDIEVICGAVPGWSTDQEGWWLASEGLRYEPDLVLLTFVANDLQGNARLRMHSLNKPRWVRDAAGEWSVEGRPVPDDPKSFRPPPSGWLWGLARRSALVHFAWAVRHGGSGAAEREPSATEPVLELGPLEATSHALGVAQRTCSEAGVPLVAVYLPHLQDMGLLSPSHPPPADTKSSYLTPLAAFLARTAAEHGFRTVSVERDLLAAVKRGEMLMLRPDGHLNERGHEVVARPLAARLAPLLRDLRGD